MEINKEKNSAITTIMIDHSKKENINDQNKNRIETKNKSN